MTIGLQGQFEGTQYPNQNYLGWPVAGRLQDVNIPPENVAFPGYQTAANLASPEWGSANNHVHPQSQGVNPSSSWAMLSSQGGSVHPVAAPSMIGPDMSFGPTPLNQE
ncbi:hypothetical protein EKO27_g10913 [Xylaria grammica]|uniref:Uncharacterized protein n=1 Tax=Xylaria grammica TaxID=363999 RepID=A0A439CPW4_9PEZI|nr:hypothetical protein EKO27_g10913 [Xylaria grammica]